MFILAAHLTRQHLAQLHPPLIERVDAPDEALQGTQGSAQSSGAVPSHQYACSHILLIAMPHESKEWMPQMKRSIVGCKAESQQAHHLQPCASSSHKAAETLLCGLPLMLVWSVNLNEAA